jgi:hypothetical protein
MLLSANTVTSGQVAGRLSRRSPPRTDGRRIVSCGPEEPCADVATARLLDGSTNLLTASPNFAPLTSRVGRGTLVGDGSAGLPPELPTGEPGAFFGSG